MNPLKTLNQLINSGSLDQAKQMLSRLKIPKEQKFAIQGVICLREGDENVAVNFFERSLALNPVEPTAVSGYSRYLLKHKKRNQAIELTERGYAAHPTNAQIVEVHAAALAEMDRIPEAISTLEPLIQGGSPSTAQIVTFSSLLRSNLEPERALRVLQTNEEKLRDLPIFQKALADCLAEISPEEASEQFQKLGPRATKSSMWNRSFTELRLGKFSLGWSLYENGLSDEVGRVGRPLPAQVKGLPMVNELDSLDTTKWTLFSTEQGIGDQVLFLSTMKEALVRFPKSAILCEQRMAPILARSFPEIDCYPYAMAHNFEAQVARINGVFPIGSLMKVFRNSTDSFKNTTFPYVKPNEAYVEALGVKLREKYPGQTLVGVSWVGGYWDRQQKTKSVEFKEFGSLLERIPNVRFISLQYGDVSLEKRYAKERGLPVTFIDGIDFKKDIDKWIALIAICDYHISVSTALVHFAGAMGKRVELLLGERQAPFIWGLGEGISLPYPSIKIHRKKLSETLPDFFARIQASTTP